MILFKFNREFLKNKSPEKSDKMSRDFLVKVKIQIAVRKINSIFVTRDKSLP
jgi:hypothetical protein